MNFKEELAQMQTRYDRFRLPFLSLSRPKWLRDGNSMAAIYEEKEKLLRQGKLCYAQIVQANTLLFQPTPDVDCPANIIYSADPRVAENPDILQELATLLFSYKNKNPDSVPTQWQEIARVITDEYDYADYQFDIDWEGQRITFRFMPIMVFRKLIPKRMLCGGLLPILTSSNCRSVLILPKQYWTKSFTRAWTDRLI